MARRIYCLSLDFGREAVAAFRQCVPGQFVEIDLSKVALPTEVPADLADKAVRQILLRRPFSFSGLDVRPDGVRAELLYCVVGPATARMTSLVQGDCLQVLGPLGHGFEVPKGTRQALLVAGGMGAGPVLHLAKALITEHPDLQVRAFVGAKTRQDLPFEPCQNQGLHEFANLGISHCVSTDDGSYGERGFVTALLEAWLPTSPQHMAASTVVYACGPEPMLAAVARIAAKAGMGCQVSMEQRMACGFGVCQGCAVECRGKNGGDSVYKLCCQDGPVFDGRDLWP